MPNSAFSDSNSTKAETAVSGDTGHSIGWELFVLTCRFALSRTRPSRPRQQPCSFNSIPAAAQFGFPLSAPDNAALSPAWICYESRRYCDCRFLASGLRFKLIVNANTDWYGFAQCRPLPKAGLERLESYLNFARLGTPLVGVLVAGDDQLGVEFD